MTESKDYLENVDPMNFVRLAISRNEIIDASDPTPLPEIYAVNEKAKALHPKEQHFIIDKVIEHGLIARSYELIPNVAKGTKSCAFFRAGQYLSVFLNMGGSVVSRPYTISSSPKDALNGKYVITVKDTEDGFASTYIFNNWEKGLEVITSGPEGNFYYEPLRDAKHIVGIAGGCGITPFHSLACAIADGIEDCSLTILYGSSTKDKILFKDELHKLEDKCSVIHVLSDERADGYETGFITADLIKKYAPKNDYSIFLCGPQLMYDFIDKEIKALGIPLRRIRHELYGAYKLIENDKDFPKHAVGKHFKLTVTVPGKKHEITCFSHENLLVAMERSGISAPNLCRSGDCGYCHSRLVRGNVFIPKSVDGRRLADFKFGYVHPCCSFPTSDVEIDVPAKQYHPDIRIMS